MDQKIAQVGFKINKWEMILNNNSLRDQKETFFPSKNGEKKEKKIMGP